MGVLAECVSVFHSGIQTIGLFFNPVHCSGASCPVPAQIPGGVSVCICVSENIIVG